MPPKRNPLKLNNLQLRTLAIAQVLADVPGAVQRDEATGDVMLVQLPHPHGDHVHIGDYVVSNRDASGLSNEAVWVALARKGLAKREGILGVTLTAAGMDYDTGLTDRFDKATH